MEKNRIFCRKTVARLAILTAFLLASFTGWPPNAECTGLPGCTFLGGSNSDGDWPASVSAVDENGNVFIAGATSSLDFPVTTGAWNDVYNGGANDVFIARLTPDLTSLQAATFLGGSASDRALAIKIDGDNRIWIAGTTESSDFPASAEAYDASYNGGVEGPYGSGDAFVAILTNDLSNLEASTYWGGSGHDIATSLTIVSGDTAFITGSTNSPDLPIPFGSYCTDLTSGGQFGDDVYIAAFSSELSNLSAATYIGGNRDDFCEAIAINASGVYVTGWITSQNFPTSEGAYDRTYNGHSYDAFVSCFNASLTQLTASTYLGGSSWEFAYELTLGSDGFVFVAGHTASTDFPVSPAAYDDSYNGSGGANIGDDVFVTKLNSDLTGLTASTYLGGSAWENAYGLVSDSEGSLYVVGSTSSSNFPVSSGAFDVGYDGGSKYAGDAFISKFKQDLTACTASAYLGGNSDDNALSINKSSTGNLIVSGYTASSNFPVTAGSFDDDYNGGDFDAYVALLKPDLSPDTDTTPTPTPTETPSQIWYDLQMPDTMLQSGEIFLLKRVCGNPLSSPSNLDEYIILDILGLYFFWPGWSEEMDSQSMTIAPGGDYEDAILTFTWPDIEGSMTGIRFWGAILIEKTMDLVSYDMVEWSYN